jgi:hypothetical protein
VTRPGLIMFSIEEISNMAAKLFVERHEATSLPGF